MQGKYGEIIGNSDHDLPSEFKPRIVSFLILTVGCAEIIGGITFGRLSDKFGMTVVMLLGCALPCAGGIALVYLNFESSTEPCSSLLPARYTC